ncbi:MAG: hypothetical protein A2W97_00950 [Bacteroidetes bacterium GWE2_40_63]|nr:MAG: hypothetical protein A2W96_10630 [Bacteroidetes bacterium GWD2_40_43]OFX95626.1 MAG: hypothetical protein A2W97_00950 [Bacteroidetes bacterium GWE2_40_63]HBX86008.1 hypothetical protein [Marinilabiliales bacterium]
MRYMTGFNIILFLMFFFQACANNSEIKSKSQKDEIKIDSSKVEVEKKKCDTELVLRIEQSISNLSQNDILEFINNINSDCKNNVEFIEYYNEVLFEVLEKYPAEFCNCMKSVDRNQQELICEELKEPVNDGINLENVKKAVENSGCQAETKGMILESIKVALDKYKN